MLKIFFLNLLYMLILNMVFLILKFKVRILVLKYEILGGWNVMLIVVNDMCKN